MAAEIRREVPERNTPFVHDVLEYSDLALADFGEGSDYSALASLVRLSAIHLELSGFIKDGEARDEAHTRRILAITDLAVKVLALARLGGVNLGKTLEEKYK